VKTYITLPFRYLAGRKLRSFLTTLAVVFGVAVVFAVNMILPPLTSAFEASELGVTGQVDMTVTSATGAPFPADALDAIAQTGGVADVAPAFHTQVALPSAENVPTFDLIGLDPNRAETVRYYKINDGRFLNGDDTQSAVVSQPFADAVGLNVGDRFSVPSPNGTSEFEVVGVFDTPTGNQVLVPMQSAQDLFNADGKLTAVDVTIVEGANREEVEQALQEKLGTGYNVGSLASNTAFSSSLQIGLVVFNIFGILTLFMGAFLIFNTFRTVVVERRRDIGMLRAVGATRGTITRLILIESALQGVIGTAIGLVLGYLLGRGLIAALQGLLDQFFRVRLDDIIVPPEAVILSVTLGIGMTVLAGLFPALSAGRLTPLAALRADAEGAPSAAAERRVSISTIIGIGLVVLGAVSLFLDNSSLVVLGSVLILTGLVFLAPLLLNPVARVLDPVIHWLFAREGLLAQGNLKRNPGRASVTVSALLIALAVVVALASVFTSIGAAYEKRARESLGADVLLLPANFGVWNGDVGVGEEFQQQFSRLDGIGDWAGLSYAPTRVGDTVGQVIGLDPATYPKVAGITFDHGDESAYAQLSDGRTAIVSTLFANSQGLKIGGSMVAQTPNGEQSYRIVGVGSDYLGTKLNTMYISQQNMAEDFGTTDDVILMANLEPGADREAVKAGVEGLLQSYPQLTLHWGADVVAEQVRLQENLFILYYGLMAAIMIPSALGLINTLTINVLERTREIGVLRAIGATQSQVRRLVVAESLLLAMAGSAIGILAGLTLGYAFTKLVGDVAYAVDYFFPLAGILFGIAVALILALLASLLPARQAARVKIVQALQYE
jgi:putative ABC transport system permease protein